MDINIKSVEIGKSEGKFCLIGDFSILNPSSIDPLLSLSKTEIKSVILDYLIKEIDNKYHINKELSELYDTHLIGTWNILKEINGTFFMRLIY